MNHTMFLKVHRLRYTKSIFFVFVRQEIKKSTNSYGCDSDENICVHYR